MKEFDEFLDMFVNDESLRSRCDAFVAERTAGLDSVDRLAKGFHWYQIALLREYHEWVTAR